MVKAKLDTANECIEHVGQFMLLGGMGKHPRL